MIHTMPTNLYTQLEEAGIRILNGRARLYAALSLGHEICLGPDEQGLDIYVKVENGQLVVNRRPDLGLTIVVVDVPGHEPAHGPNGDLADCLCNECTAGIGDGP